MQIELPKSIAQKLVKALSAAGCNEIGGILMGEHISPGKYKIANITVQNLAGTSASFLRLPYSLITTLRAFFQKTGNQFVRFNYLGEWHSHPSFSLEPSYIDCESMWEIVDDLSIGANFAVLLIVKLNKIGSLEGGVTIFIPNHQMQRANLFFTA